MVQSWNGIKNIFLTFLYKFYILTPPSSLISPPFHLTSISSTFFWRKFFSKNIFLQNYFSRNCKIFFKNIFFKIFLKNFLQIFFCKKNFKKKFSKKFFAKKVFEINFEWWNYLLMNKIILLFLKLWMLIVEEWNLKPLQNGGNQVPP